MHATAGLHNCGATNRVEHTQAVPAPWKTVVRAYVCASVMLSHWSSTVVTQTVTKQQMNIVLRIDYKPLCKSSAHQHVGGVSPRCSFLGSTNQLCCTLRTCQLTQQLVALLAQYVSTLLEPCHTEVGTAKAPALSVSHSQKAAHMPY